MYLYSMTRDFVNDYANFQEKRVYMYAILFPNLNPVAISLGYVDIYWYSLAYIVGILCGAHLLQKRLPKSGIHLSSHAIENIIIYVVAGIIIGGRLGYVLLYHPEYFWQDIPMVFKVWSGGMSFHGGALGLTVAMGVFCKRYNIEFLRFMDQLVCIAPIGLFLGRIANFVNQELYGRVTDVPWAIIFPNGGYLPRHPSQLYEALLEGILLFIILHIMRNLPKVYNCIGVLSGSFLALYAVMRIFVEIYREPDIHLGYWLGYFTAGQIYSLPFLLIGILLICYAIVTPKVKRG